MDRREERVTGTTPTGPPSKDMMPMSPSGLAISAMIFAHCTGLYRLDAAPVLVRFLDRNVAGLSSSFLVPCCTSSSMLSMGAPSNYIGLDDLMNESATKSGSRHGSAEDDRDSPIEGIDTPTACTNTFVAFSRRPWSVVIDGPA